MPKTSAPAARATTRRGGAESRAGSPYTHRLARLSRAIGEIGDGTLSHLLVTNFKDVAYLTGFLGGDSYLLVPAGLGNGKSARPVLISDFRYKEELEPIETAGLAAIFIRSRSMIEAVGEVVSSVAGGENGGDGKIGVQAEHLSVAERAAAGRRIPGGAKRLHDTSGVVARLRVIKDEHEIGLIRKAAKIQEAALEAVLPTIRVGQTELEVAARLEMEMKLRGSSEPGFQTIVAAGPNGSLPHYRPQNRKIAAGKPLLIDWGAVYQGYHSDMTRTFTMGKWSPKMREVFQIVLDAQLKAADALAPGRTTREVDAVARDHITRHGYGEFFGHGLGHGLGLNGHEDPRLTNMLAPARLEVGMVVTVEPGIYLPGVGGVRIEDDYVITERGATNLCSLAKDLEWGTL